jgi:iron complex outermembrane recepter protein
VFARIAIHHSTHAHATTRACQPIASIMFHPLTTFSALTLAATSAIAQSGNVEPPATPTAPPASATPRDQSVVVTGSSVGRGEAAPVSVLSGDELERRRGTSLGDTLSRLPGVSSTYFGPNANRPTIRGQDGERVRILANGGASADASTLSFDHAVPIDPLVIERLEVLRGPAALLYGGSAIGGAVNTIDNRIPSAALGGLQGAALLRLGGAARERGASALLEGGASGLAWHLDGFARRQDDLRVPGFDVVVDEGTGATERRDRIVNSSSESKGGAAGLSRVWAGGYAGLSVDTFRSEYGSIAEEEIRIRMRRERVAAQSQAALDGGPIAQLRVQAAATRYAHDEIEDGAVGTQFRNRAQDARVEVNHRPFTLAVGSLAGTWGVQLEQGRFSALGEEAFVPPSRTRQAAMFGLETWTLSRGTELSLGLRAERVGVDSSGDAAGAEEPRFGGPVQRRFSPASASLGAQWQVGPAWQLLANVSSTQRAPASHELYADGVHAATGAFERGNPRQGLERARHVELGAQVKAAGGRVKLNAFATRYAKYIALVPTGETFAEGTESFPVYAYVGVPARLHGAELEATWPLKLGASSLDFGMQWEIARGTNRATGEPLPRLAPMRATASVDWTHGPSLVRLEVQHAAKQTRVPTYDTPTPAWTQVHLLASHRWALPAGEAMLYGKLVNLTNELAFNAATLGTVRDRAPLPGRGFAAGLQWRW